MSTQFSTDVVADGGNGNLPTLTKIGFSFRLSTELTLGNMIIYECEWQKRLRQAAQKKADEKYVGDVWVEPQVSSNLNSDGTPDLGFLTKPFPGLDAWDNGAGATYAQIDDQFYDITDGGTPKPRGPKGVNYKTVEPPKVSAKEFKDRYPVNKQ